jgi:diguanylate cyclase (GGDEF)-like protein/PAS domain S-box-containing protein
MHDPHHLLRVTLASIRDAVVTTDDTASILLFNPAAEALTGWTQAEAVGKPIEQILELRENGTDIPIPNPAHALLRDGAHSGKSVQTLLIGKSGRRIAVEISASPLHDSAGQVTGSVLVFYDIGEALQLAERMAYQAQHDSVTGLPNRILLVDRLEQAAKIADRHSDHLAVLFVDLDAFNNIHSFNELREIIGTTLADDLLREVAYRFSEALRESDTVCRLSGTEFIVLITGIKSTEDIEALAVKLLFELTRPYALAGSYSLANQTAITASSSIGIAIYPRDASDVATLMRLADGAMSQATQAGRNQYRFAGQQSDSIISAGEI